ALARAGMMRIPLRTGKEDAARGPLLPFGRVGSPEGRTGVVATALIVRAGRCPRLGPQAEIVVEEPEREAGPALRGPVIGSLVPGRDDAPGRFIEREPLPLPADTLVDLLVDRTRRAIDSVLAREHGSVRAEAARNARLEINSLGDLDAADVTPYHVGDGRVRYAVSLRERRVPASGADTLVAVGVMAWDESGAWQQFIFRPQYLVARRGRLLPFRSSRPYFWRRLGAVSDFGFDRDNLWMEQVDVRDGAVLWGIIQPSDNVVVAAAEMGGGCR
ncbi:MAG TPA: hypothetical protein VFU00_10370, partial [Gemmatimonadales bacterium]|nr:hypothetical protein [Gemmatimonadales bacterium]